MKDILDLKVKKVAANIRRIREYRNYTQEYLAAKLRISQNAYSKIELSHTRVTIDRLFRIADILGVDPIAILNCDGSEYLSAINGNTA
jgi:transcriptional regulator with XRE-family HTH domain